MATRPASRLFDRRGIRRLDRAGGASTGTDQGAGQTTGGGVGAVGDLIVGECYRGRGHTDRLEGAPRDSLVHLANLGSKPCGRLAGEHPRAP